MKELRVATKDQEFERLLKLREINLERCLINPNENKVYSELLKNPEILWERQYLFGYRILDFYSQDLKIAVEVDGLEHDKEYDNYRDEYLFRVYGIVVLRVRNNNEEDLKVLNKNINLVGRSSYNKRNPLFKEILGVNPPMIMRERLSIALPYNDDISLLGRFINSRGIKSDYQKFNWKPKSHWKQIFSEYSKATYGYSEKTTIQNVLSDNGIFFVKFNGNYLINPSTEAFSKYKKWKTVDSQLCILYEDFSFSFYGTQGIGLESFMKTLGICCDNLLARTTTGFRESGGRSGESLRITLKDYVNKRSGKNGVKALSKKEIIAFSIDYNTNWLERFGEKTLEVHKVIKLIDDLIKAGNIHKQYVKNLKIYKEELINI